MILATGDVEVITAIGSVVGGLGAAVGGIAAWRSAKASRETSRDALEALALGIVPTVVLELSVDPLEGSTDRGHWTARLFNTSQFAARDIVIDAAFQDGKKVREETGHIDPGEHFVVALREIEMPPGGPTREEAGKTLTLRYSDERHLARYEQPYAFTLRKDGAGTYFPTASVVPESARVRIS